MIRALDSAALHEGGRVVVLIEGKAIALVRVEGIAYAIADTCPHRGGSLGLGDLSGHHLYCPLHAWCFDVRTGRAFFPKDAIAATHRVEERAGEIFVDPIAVLPGIDFVPPQ
jgi:nitrite reductase (NADH) small subunit